MFKQYLYVQAKVLKVLTIILYRQAYRDKGSLTETLI
jgi:hypothetical protein